MEEIYVLYTLEVEHISGIFQEIVFHGFTTDKAVAQAWIDQHPPDDSGFCRKDYTYEEVHRI